MQRKYSDFQKAMDLYNSCSAYYATNIATSILIILLQVLSIITMLRLVHIEYASQYVFPIILSYIATDFINGCVHMYMDNNTNYRGILGPFVAAFHLHHLAPAYRKRNPLKVYFYESGSKFWLLGYLVVLNIFQSTLSPGISVFFVGIGMFSSFAEVSHYWCHNATDNDYIIRSLQNLNILLSKKHHRIHHQEDNKHYAFLNGIADPLINIIAFKLFDGYKSHSDLHTMAYRGKQTSNR